MLFPTIKLCAKITVKISKNMYENYKIFRLFYYNIFFGNISVNRVQQTVENAISLSLSLFLFDLSKILFPLPGRYKMPRWAAPQTMRTFWACYADRAPLRMPSSTSGSVPSPWAWSLRLSAPARRVLKLWS